MTKTNTKGFTLLELLAVITIMGVLIIIGIPAIIRIIENSKKDISIATAKQYTQAVKNCGHQMTYNVKWLDTMISIRLQQHQMIYILYQFIPKTNCPLIY